MHLTERDVIEAFSKKRFLQLLLTTLQTFAMTPNYATNFCRTTQPYPKLLPSPETSSLTEKNT